MRRLTLLLLIIGLLILAGCNNNGSSEDVIPTSTLAPIVTRTVRVSATPFTSPTPLPTRTYTPTVTPIPPTATNTFTPTATEPVIGSVNSLQTVNIREGPGTEFSAIEALVPGTGVEVIGQNTEGTWYEVLLESGERGWISAALLRLQPTTTPFPTFTPSPDLTALALGTPLPTAVLGGGTVTPTPPRSVITPSPAGTATADANASSGTGNGTPTSTEPFLPIRDVTALYQTATALAGGISIITPRPNPQATITPTGQSPNSQAPTAGAGTVVPTQAVNTPVVSGNASTRDGVDVFALCNNPAFGLSAPTNLAAGSTIDIFWAWYMNNPDLIDQHLNAVTYEVRINDQLLEWRQYGIGTRQEGNSWVKYWFVPFGPLAAGQYNITYRATWSTAITDGFEQFGPGTRNPVEEGSCTFTVR